MLAVVISLGVAGFCHAQITTMGIINGTVTDPAGLAVAGAKVSITNTGTRGIFSARAVLRFAAVTALPITATAGWVQPARKVA